MALRQSQLTDTGRYKPLKSNCNTAVANLREAALRADINRKTRRQRCLQKVLEQLLGRKHCCTQLKL
ncbi:MAG: hypothetical protein V7K48_18120 [Nostoc sp.]|uniref:hypothetical protein n=1 Tax=Nostoc sp. TaxID=1180 RepID=UPI002FF90D2E